MNPRHFIFDRLSFSQGNYYSLEVIYPETYIYIQVSFQENHRALVHSSCSFSMLFIAR